MQLSNNIKIIILCVVVVVIIVGIYLLNRSQTPNPAPVSTSSTPTKTYSPTPTPAAPAPTPTPTPTPAAPAPAEPASVGCPSGSSMAGTGVDIGNGCRCDTPLLYWNGNICTKCPEGSRTDWTGTAVDSNITGIKNCKCLKDKGYWKPNLNICENCPGKSVLLSVIGGVTDLSQFNQIVTEGTDPWNTPGHTPELMCRCPGTPWPCL